MPLTHPLSCVSRSFIFCLGCVAGLAGPCARMAVGQEKTFVSRKGWFANSKAEDFWEKTEIQTCRRKKSQPYILLRLNPLPFCNSQNQPFSFTKKIGHHAGVNAQVNPLCSQTMVRGAPQPLPQIQLPGALGPIHTGLLGPQ